MRHVSEYPSSCESSFPLCILKLQGQGILLEAKSLAGLIFTVIRRSSYRIEGEQNSFYSGSENGLHILAQLPDGISLAYHYISILTPIGHTDAFNVWNPFDSFQHTLAD